MNKLSHISYKNFGFALFIGLILGACSENNDENYSSKEDKIFTLLSPQKSGIRFNNLLEETEQINYFTYPYIYMGGGVAVGDLNNDGLSDIYFTGNMVKNKLYLNEGKLKFKDISQAAGIEGDNRWVTGVTMADVNGDGWLDIYVSVSGAFATRKNLLYIHQGLDDKGIPHFSEEAEAYGIADEGYSTQGTFFDYDLDGDLDLYVANYPPSRFANPPAYYRAQMDHIRLEDSDHLYRNEGNGKFTDVTEEAKLMSHGLSLSATVSDFNQDGFPDIYVSCDFASPDYFYFNNGDGTFQDQVRQVTKHTSFYAMGTDIADFNNDARLDIVQAEMLPKDNKRSKANMASMNPAQFWKMIDLELHYQYMQNALQLNVGEQAKQLPHFSDIARMAGVSSTDWSWAPLFADLDNDGWKDLFISNGSRRDINNKDYFNTINEQISKYLNNTKPDYLAWVEKMPSQKLVNYIGKNKQDLTFKHVAQDWGIDQASFANGAAYADLDNDGDLELIINNIDDIASIYENKSSDRKLNNFLRIKLKGNADNPFALGTKVLLENGEEKQYQELTLSRGFQSSVEPIVHFGLGKKNLIDKITITWPDGKKEILTQVNANQLLTLNYQNAKNNLLVEQAGSKPWFEDITNELALHFRHQENDLNDYQWQVLLPHKMSQFGPALAVGDVNGDKLDDFYIGGAKGFVGTMFLQQANGTFKPDSLNAWVKDQMQEDVDATLFDANGDGSLDLYVVSGGNAYEANAPQYQDRLYLNDGQGNFKKAMGALPEIYSSGSCVIPADIDKDGDLDLFVGGRHVPHKYPLPAASYILENQGQAGDQIVFKDITTQVAPELSKAGLVTDALWTDFDGDQKIDLVICGEWMPITFLKNTGDKFENITEQVGLGQSTGWWYSLQAKDMDADGDLDFIAGNLGLNYKYQTRLGETFDVYCQDFDNNQKLDIVLGYYNEGVQYPLRGRQCSSEQMPEIKKKFKNYNDFGLATLKDIYTEDALENALHYQAKTFASAYIENQGNGKFELKALPNWAQLSSVNSILVEDINQDQYLDIILAGNLYTSEVETPRNDGGVGMLLLGDGQGHFNPLPAYESGLFMPADTKEMAFIQTSNGKAIIFANNDDYLKILKIKTDDSEKMLSSSR